MSKKFPKEKNRKPFKGILTYTNTMVKHPMYNAEEKMRAILRILEDQFPLPVPVSEITSAVNISAEKVESFLRFLAKYRFVTYNEERKMATIHADFLSLKE